MLQPLFWFHPGNSRACLLFLLCVLVVHSKESDRKDPVSSALGSDLVPYLQQSFPYWAKSTPDIPTEPSIFQIPHIQTDRSIYKPGEVVFYRVVIVDSNKENMVLDSYLWGNMQITSPKGAVLHEEGLNTEAQSTAFNYWKIPADSPGGEYTLKATFGTTAERKFTVRNYRNPNIMINIEFTKQGYGPGDTATAIVTAKRAEGGKLSNSKISIIANIDGQEVSRQDSTFDGIQSIFHFEIPQSIIHGDGNLNVIVQDGGIVESKTETIPLITHSVDVGLFPEGGVLVSEVNNTVYFEVKSTINQEPVDSFKADLCELESDRTKCKVVIQRGIAALHEGRGMFTLVPKFGTAYALLILKPTVPVSNNLFSLPIIQQHGGVIHATKQVYQEGDAISFDFGLHLPQSNSDRKFSVSLYKRDQEISNTQILVPASEAIVTKTILFTPPQHYRGVLRATAFYLGVPIAERLVFKRQSGKLNIELTPISNQTMYTPGSKVEFQIRTTDEHGDPVSAVIGVSAVDETVLSMVPKRKRVPKLEESAFLENEVQEFMAGAEYMSNDLAINLLLGTQGWRRFIHFNTEKFLEDYEVKGQRILQPPRLRSRGYSGSGSAGDARVVMEDLDLGFQIPVMARMHKQLEDNEAVVYLAADNVDMPVLDADDHTEVPQVTIEFEDFDTVVQSYITIASTRRYAHETKPRKQDSSRFDFTQTLFWDAALVTSTTGLATVSFSLSDSITTVKVMADGMALQDGQTVYGSSETSIRSIKPFYVDMQVPLECTAGDQVDAPVYFVNGLPITLRVNAGIDVQGQSISLTSSKSTTATLYSEVRDRQSINFQAIATNQTEKSAIYVQATATDPQGTQYSDTIIRTIPVTMPGFPVSIAKGGFLEPSKEVSITLTMPDDIIDNSAHTSLYLYPTPVASLTAALESLLREPYGCFEQLSSTIYPMVMAQQYFKTHSHVDPLLIKKADTLIASGYSKLLGYETSSEGFEWFGQSPAHESLTAYGLLEFTDMATVYAVDEEVMQRTKQWVLDSREGEGFKRNSRALDTFGGAPEDITNAYIGNCI